MAGAKAQNKLPGMTQIDDDEIEGLAEKFVELRDDWQAKGKEMMAAKAALLDAASQSKDVMSAAKEHPKGKVKVGDALLTIHPKDATLDIKVKLYEEGD